METAKAVYIVVASLVQGATVLSVDRKVPLVTIKTIQMSTLRDDWFVSSFALSHLQMFDSRRKILNLGPTPEGDLVLNCYFKTEFLTHLMQQTQSGVNLTIAPMYDVTFPSLCSVAHLSYHKA